jgi:secreted PhoX family phosphatase
MSNWRSLSVITRLLSLSVLGIAAIVLLTSPNVALSFSNGQPASYVLGQPDFTSNDKFAGGLATSSKTLNSPTSLTVDSNHNLWVADTFNNRVLEYKAPFNFKGKAADIVLGQSDFTSSHGSDFGISSSSLNGPEGITFDSGGNLWVADTFNNRVLEYKAPFTNGKAADIV